MNIIKKLSLMAILVLLGAFALPGHVLALDAGSLDIVASTAEKAKEGVSAVGGGENTTDLPTFIKSIINIMLYIVGIIAVIMIIVGGIKYATSAGDTNQITSAKNTILYAIIGVVVAILAFALVNWVINALAK